MMGGTNPKGARDWMPDDAAYHCAYAFKWSYLIDKYNLASNQIDLAMIADVS